MFRLRSKSNVHVTKLKENNILKMFLTKVQKLRTETLLTEKCRTSSSEGYQRLMNEEVKCDMHVRLNYLFKICKAKL